MNSVGRAWGDLPPLFADRLMALLATPERVCHGLHRVNELLLLADRHCAPHWLRPLRWAVLYRYAIHDPLASARANAESSVELWREHFAAIHETVRNISPQWEEEAAAAIGAAAEPCRRPADFKPWQHALLDLDGAVLGEVPLVYDANRLLDAAEHAVAGGACAEWQARRTAALRAALARPRLFHVACLEREEAARRNIRRELDDLV